MNIRSVLQIGCGKTRRPLRVLDETSLKVAFSQHFLGVRSLNKNACTVVQQKVETGLPFVSSVSLKNFRLTKPDSSAFRQALVHALNPISFPLILARQATGKISSERFQQLFRSHHDLRSFKRGYCFISRWV
jgi:hypothetical protein